MPAILTPKRDEQLRTGVDHLGVIAHAGGCGDEAAHHHHLANTAKVAAKCRTQRGEKLQANREPTCARSRKVNILAINPGGVGSAVPFADLAREENKVAFPPPQDELRHWLGRRRQGMAKGDQARQSFSISRHDKASPIGKAECLSFAGDTWP